jgi:hypothetical protein
VEQPDALELRLAWIDAVGLRDDVSRRARRYVEEIFARVGVSIEWHQPEAVSTRYSADHGYYLKIMLCSYEPSEMRVSGNAMGVVIGTRFPPDAVWVFDPVIRRALEVPGRRPFSGVQRARAYARVAAHEIVHAIANSERHADSGLMAPTQTRNVLVSSDFGMDDESAGALVRGLRQIETVAQAARQ